jgi:hypothetical protein
MGAEMADYAIDMNLAKTFGLKADDFKGKSPDEQRKILEAGFKKYNEAIAEKAEKQYFDNCANILPKVKELLEDPQFVYVKAVGQKKSPTTVTIVGYLSDKKELIVYLSSTGKIYAIPESDIISTAEELKSIRGKKRTYQRKPKKIQFGSIYKNGKPVKRKT